MTADLTPIRAALKDGDKAAARRLLTPILKEQPSADAWTLAAQACDTPDAAIQCLRKALAIDAQHSTANRLLFKLEGAVPPAALEQRAREQAIAKQTAETLRQTLPPAANPLVVDKKPQRSRKPASPWRYVGCLGGVLLAASFTLIVLNMAGIVSGVWGTISRFTGGAAPVTEVDGVPLARVEDAAYLLPAAQSEPALVRDTDVLDTGLLHEYTFDGVRGREVGIYVQFLSLGANRVSRNVAIVRPDGSDGRRACQQESILEGDNNVVFVCTLDADGLWRVRIVGRDGESVGAYFVGVEDFAGS